MSKCKSCQAEIFWVTMERSSKKNPLDSVPVPDGNIVVMSVAGNEKTARAIRAEEREGLVDKGALLYVSHFVTCPNSAQHKKTKSPQPNAAKPSAGEKGEQGGATAPAGTGGTSETEALYGIVEDALRPDRMKR